ncbi:MAG: 50S ribosomal protein L11 methyltransferase, partial [Oscillospiraceae bacterium]|nr:50S ribosomal protein L11 methyltransferase [Oscillospiraceae bacterium]
LAPGGRFVCSGIIDGREAEIVSAAEKAGLAVLGHQSSEGWHCYIMSTNSEGKRWN